MVDGIMVVCSRARFTVAYVWLGRDLARFDGADPSSEVWPAPRPLWCLGPGHVGDAAYRSPGQSAREGEAMESTISPEAGAREAVRGVTKLWWFGLTAGFLMVILAFWTGGQFFFEKGYVLLVFAGIWALMQGFTDIIRAFQIRKLRELV
jgi:hypothetical protein